MRSLLDSAKLRTYLVATSLAFIGLLLALLLSANAQADAPETVAASGVPACIGPDDPQTGRHACLPVVVGTDWGGTWSRVGQDVAAVDKFYSIAVCGDHLLAGSDLGVYSLKTPAQSWTREQTGISGAITDVTFVPGDCTEAYAAVMGHGVWRGEYANADGWTWEQRVDEDDQLKDARSLVVIPDANGTPDIYVAGDFGVKWVDEPPTAEVTWEDTSLRVLTTSLTVNDDKVIASVWLDDVYLLIDAENWSRLSPTGPPEDKLIYQAVYANGLGLAGTQTGAFVLTGGVWQRVGAIQQTTFAVALGDRGLFAGQRASGVSGRLRNGSSWYAANYKLERPAGPPEFQIRDLFVHATGPTQTMYAAATNGIWKWSGTP